MYFLHSPDIWRDYPQLVAGVLVVDGIHFRAEVDSYIQIWYGKARQRLNESHEGQMSEIIAWRKAFSQMGFKPTKYRCAAESLLRRFRREDNLPRFHPFVDLCNALSLAFAIPIAVFDTTRIKEYIEVKYAEGREQYLAFNGELETPVKGEVIFVDGAGEVHARRWSFRQSKRSVLTSARSKALVVTEALHETADQDIRNLVNILTQSISKFWNTPDNQAILSAVMPRFDFA